MLNNQNISQKVSTTGLIQQTDVESKFMLVKFSSVHANEIFCHNPYRTNSYDGSITYIRILQILVYSDDMAIVEYVDK